MRSATFARVLFTLLLCAAAFWAGARFGPRLFQGGSGHGAAAAETWVCPMHPEVVLDHPDMCPKCGMPLTKVGAPSAKASGPGLQIDPAMVQNMGLRVASVTRGPLRRTLRAPGILRVAEPRRQEVTLKVGGWVERLHAATEGQRIRAGETLFELYAPELLVAQDELRAAGAVLAATPADAAEARRDAASLVEAARRKLELLDLDAGTIDAIATAPAPLRTLPFRARIDGILVERAVLQGAAVQPGQRLLTVADLSELWLDARVFEHDLALVREGLATQVTLAAQPGRTFTGRVEFVQPVLDEATRTAAVRVVVGNPDGALRPGMYAQVAIEVPLADDAVQVPGEALLDTGTRRIVFVAKALGHYEPREVRAGRAGADGTVEVLAGLVPGETVVASGQFLLDAESRLREAMGKLGGHALHTTAATQPQSRPALQVDAALRQRVDALLLPYLKLAESLAADGYDAAAVADLRAAAATLAAARPAGIEDLVVGLPAAVDALASGRPEFRGAHFVPLSDAVVRLAEVVAPSPAVADRLYVVRCPMPPVDGQGLWLQRSEAVRNPFFGSKMLECGDVLRTVPAGGR
ncbi:MAG: efflux RND transporter periplasmic adaptor subunit [Planctomycetes bacterium]|nr:efflux RND transporter periplasmic adaptor subunit [Planctomycetota bacterium]